MSLALKRKKPSERNVEIYYAILADELTRQEVAEKHKITPQRVSKIVKTVGAWVLKKGMDESLGAEEQSYLAHDAYLHGVRKFKLLALAAFDQTRQDKVAPEKTAAPGKWTPGKPDVRLLAKAMDADKAIRDAAISRAHAQERMQAAQKRREQDPLYCARQSRLAEKKERRQQEKRDRRRQQAIEKAQQQAERQGITAQLKQLAAGGMDAAAEMLAKLQAPPKTETAIVEPLIQPGEDRQQPPPPAGAMREIRVVDGEEQEIWKNAEGETIWVAETYDYGEDTSRPIESADGRCFSGKLVWRTEAEIDAEFRVR